MNDHYFNCMDCKRFIEAGYRWGYFTLVQDGPITIDQPIDVEAVFQVNEFWNPPTTKGHDWIREILPGIQDFLIAHKEHTIIYNDRQVIENERSGFDWVDKSSHPQLTPRYLAEVFQLQSWEDVENKLKKEDIAPWWWVEQDEKLPPEYHETLREAHDIFMAYRSKNRS